MKKLMMAAAIVCAACIANAASVSWAAYQYAGGEIQDYGYCNDLAAGSSIVLCLMDGTSVNPTFHVRLDGELFSRRNAA